MNFQFRSNLIIALFIIVIIGAMWILIELLSYSFGKTAPVLTENEIVSKEVSYLEKIDQFSLQEFDDDQNLSHFVQAKNYFNFKNRPALLLDPKVTTYDKLGKEDYTLSAQRANYLDSGEIKFTNEVDIHSNGGATHKINTEELFIGIETDDLVSHKKVVYLGERGRIVAQGMHMHAKQDKLRLIGKIVIYQDGGQRILTKNLHIDQSDGKKHYSSKDDTSYLAKHNKIYADGVDINMKTELLTLIGKVKILQKTGSKINTNNLSVDQSRGGEVYRTNEKIHYQSRMADIRAIGMNYDAKNQKIKLTGGVVGRYE
ncbi:MAG: LPS export ABC transporter periplasmic protein LptC [Gammaproteobacteria bacterium]|nr:LPS export ABC transporter periplasmic protein LptC [Gammaproteobacteria bacterium]